MIIGADAQEPRIAVLIPVYNEEPVIAGTIKALIQADAERGDIYVVDDKSTDKTAEIARSMGVNVYTMPQNGGKAKAQAAAIKHFHLSFLYDWVIFLDGDTKVDPYFINAMYLAIKQHPEASLFVGEVKSIPDTHIFSAARAFDYTFAHDIAKRAQSNFNVIYVSPGCASMYRASLLRYLDFDSNTLAEDMDLTMQVLRRGEKALFIPDAFVNTQDPATLKDYHKQILRWSRGVWQVIKKQKVFGWRKKNLVDLYLWMIIADSFFFNKVLWAAFLLLTAPSVVPFLFAMDFAVTAGIAAWCSYRTKRWDVLYKMPIYYWISILHVVVWLRAFIEIMVLRQNPMDWNKVKRYSFDSVKTGI